MRGVPQQDRDWVDRGLVDRLRRSGSVFAKDELSALRSAHSDADGLEQAVLARERGALVEHLVGSVDFLGLELAISAGVFVPRSRTEPLVQAATARLRTHVGDGGRATVLDLGCGTGAFAAVLAQSAPAARVLASDSSSSAVECALANGARYGFEVLTSDWCRQLPTTLRGEVDLVVTYLPHVPTPALAALPRDALEQEGRPSFDGGPDGLDGLRSVLAQLPEHLSGRGAMFTLVSEEQVKSSRAAAAETRWRTAIVSEHQRDVVLQLEPH